MSTCGKVWTLWSGQGLCGTLSRPVRLRYWSTGACQGQTTDALMELSSTKTAGTYQPVTFPCFIQVMLVSTVLHLLWRQVYRAQFSTTPENSTYFKRYKIKFQELAWEGVDTCLGCHLCDRLWVSKFLQLKRAICYKPVDKSSIMIWCEMIIINSKFSFTFSDLTG